MEKSKGTPIFCSNNPYRGLVFTNYPKIFREAWHSQEHCTFVIPYAVLPLEMVCYYSFHWFHQTVSLQSVDNFQKKKTPPWEISVSWFECLIILPEPEWEPIPLLQWSQCWQSCPSCSSTNNVEETRSRSPAREEVTELNNEFVVGVVGVSCWSKLSIPLARPPPLCKTSFPNARSVATCNRLNFVV